MIAPVLLMLILGIVCFGVIFATYNSVQQLAGEAARASVGGLSVAERDQLARGYVTSNIGNYGILDLTKLAVTTTAQATTFQVALTYNMSASPVFTLSKLVPMPSSLIIRTATIGNGGF